MGVGSRVEGLGLSVLDLGMRVEGWTASARSAHGFCLSRVQGLGFCVLGLGFGVWGLGFGVQGFGFWV